MKQEKYGFVYLWFDKKHKRYYIGCHWGTEDDGYICSSNWMRDAYRRRPQDFKRRTLSKIHTNIKDMFDKECEWLSLIENTELKTKYYNISKAHKNQWSTNTDTRSIRQKISDTQKGRRNSPDTEFKKGERTSIKTEFKKGKRASPTTEFKTGHSKGVRIQKGERKSPSTEFKKGEVSHNAIGRHTPYGTFDSKRQARMKLNMGNNRIKNYLNDENNTEWYYINRK